MIDGVKGRHRVSAIYCNSGAAVEWGWLLGKEVNMTLPFLHSPPFLNFS